MEVPVFYRDFFYLIWFYVILPMNQSKKQRKIIHIDMDAFYAAVEQRDFPRYRYKPLAIGSPSKRGVIATASYEARQYGIHSAMPSAVAIRKCPNLIFAPPRFHVYKKISSQIHSIFHEYTSLVEPLSLDEAFLDVTDNKKQAPSATHIAKEIRDKINTRTGLTASAGISVNKFLAKIASDINKPDGMKVIKPEEVQLFIQGLSITKFFGVGKVTAAKMNRMGIFTGKDLQQKSLAELIEFFGKNGIYYYHIARGIDHRPVQPTRTRKSIGAEETFHEDIVADDLLLSQLKTIIQEVWRRMSKIDVFGKTLTLKIKYYDFTINTHSTTRSNYIQDYDELSTLSQQLLDIRRYPDKPIRLLGLSVSNLNNQSTTVECEQLCLDLK